MALEVNVFDSVGLTDSPTVSIPIGESFVVKVADASTAIQYNMSARKTCRTSNGDLHCVYYRNDGTTNQIYYSTSDDDGETWSETKLTNEAAYGAGQRFACIAVDSSDNLHVVFNGRYAASSTITQVRYMKYAGSWSGITNLTTDIVDDQDIPSIAVDSSDNLHVVWEGKHAGSTSYSQIRYMVYTGSWSGITDISDAVGEVTNQQWPCLAIDSNDYIHVVWNSDTPVFYRRYTTSWQAIVEVCDTGYSSALVSLAIDSSDNIHVVFPSRDAGHGVYTQIKYNKSLDNGATFEGLETLTDDSSYAQQYPNIAVDGTDTIHITWHGQHSGSATYRQIRYIYNDGSWSGIAKITRDESEHNRYPAMFWAFCPTIGGAQTNRPATGFAFVWMDDVTVKYWRSFDLTWDAAAGVLSVNVTDNIGVSDEVEVLVPVLEVSVSDTIGLTESVDTFYPLLEIAVGDIIGLTDGATVIRQDAGVLNVYVYDNVQVAEAAASMLNFYDLSVADDIGISDEADIQIAVYEVSVYDTLTCIDEQTVLLTVLNVAVSDSLILSDAVDIVIPGAALDVDVYDIIGLADIVACVRLPDWQPPTDGSSVEWTQVSEASDCAWSKTGEVSSAVWSKV